MIPPLVYPLRAKRSALCFTIPVLAEELVYREVLFFFPFPPFPLGGKLIPSGRPEIGKQEFKTEWSYTAKCTFSQL